MDTDVHDRFRAAIFCVPSMFPMLAILPAAAMPRKNAAGSREQGDNADQQNDVFHISYCFVISSEGVLVRWNRFLLANTVPFGPS
jgi:hypothetical protein